MPISIQCPACKREYKVDDKLAGKKVKCKQCGEVIAVASELEEQEPDIFAIDDSAGEPAPAAKGPSVRRCPSCRTPNTPSAITCVACGMSLRPEPAVEVESIPLTEKVAVKKKRKFVRDPGNPTLNSVDSLINLIVWWGSIAALAVWIVHIARTMGGLQMSSLVPLILVLGVGAVIIAPLMMIAIKITAKYADFIPRDDTFNRVLLALVLPFGVALLAGWNAAAVTPLIYPALFLGVGLFVYLFRGEPKEWIATVIAGGVALGIGWFVAGLLANAIASGTGPLYADMLPEGPWQSFTTGHSPPPAPPEAPQVAVGPNPTPSTQGSTLPFVPLPPEKQPPGVTVVPGTPGVPNGSQQRVAAVTPAPTTPSGVPQPVPLTPEPQPPAPGATSQPSFFADVSVDDKNLQDIRELLPATAPAPWLLVVKGSESGSATAERWSVQPTVKKGSQTFSELPKQPNSYAISPKGDTLVAVVHFPRNQIQISSFDNKNVKSIPLDEPRAVPSLRGFLDNTRVCLEWEMGGMVRLQIWSTYTGTAIRTIIPEGYSSFEKMMAFSPNGRLLAYIGRGTEGEQQIILINVDTGVIARRITATSAQFKPLGLAFSPDSSQIALYAVVSDVTTLLSFKCQTGAPAYTGMLATTPSTTPIPRDVARPPGLLWLQNNLAWLVDGNDLYETTSGKKIGSLNLPDLVDVKLAGQDSIAFVQTTAEGTKKATIAKFDDAQIKQEVAKMKE